MNKLIVATLLTVASSSGYALIPLGFDAVTLTAIPHEAGLPVSLTDQNGRCKFYGETRAQPKTGFFNELFDRRDYFVDISKFVCGDTETTVKSISAIYENPLKVGDKIRLPYIEFVISQTISTIETFYNNIAVKCESGAVWYTLEATNIPMQIPLWVDGKTISCSNDSYQLGDKVLSKDDVKKLIVKDMNMQPKPQKKQNTGGGIPVVDPAAVLQLDPSQKRN